MLSKKNLSPFLPVSSLHPLLNLYRCLKGQKKWFYLWQKDDYRTNWHLEWLNQFKWQEREIDFQTVTVIVGGDGRSNNQTFNLLFVQWLDSLSSSIYFLVLSSPLSWYLLLSSNPSFILFSFFIYFKKQWRLYDSFPWFMIFSGFGITITCLV